MIKVENLSYSYQQKDLYKNISFTVADDVHCALIGTNGTGKSTLLNLLIRGEDYLYDGKIEFDGAGRIGYVSQFSQADRKEDLTVFEYIADGFIRLEQSIADYCREMETAADLERIFEKYQAALDEFQAVDGDHWESNIKKQLKIADLQKLEQQKLNSLSGGEWKLIQVIKEMMASPGLLIMDEPDVFLDFKHLNALRDLINAHKGTLLVVTHNRYLLNHCFDKILHMENRDLQEFDGSYMEYNYGLLAAKIDLAEAAAEDQAEIERQSKILEKARLKATRMDNASLGRAVHARQTMVDRLKVRKTKAPFVEISQPEIHFKTWGNVAEDEVVLKLEDYSVAFDEQLLEHVDFEIRAKEHVAIVGSNGTGKTTLLREIYQGGKASVRLCEHVVTRMFSQVTDTSPDDSKTLLELFEEKDCEAARDASGYLMGYGFEEEGLRQRINELSGGERDLFWLAMISREKADFLLLDEPTGHLDVYAQRALEQAVLEYEGAVLMVSHDFYTVSNCVDYVLLVENNTVRRMSVRKFRQMIYADYFDRDYLLLEQEKKEVEMRIERYLKSNEFEQAKLLMEPLGELIKKMAAAV